MTTPSDRPGALRPSPANLAARLKMAGTPLPPQESEYATATWEIGNYDVSTASGTALMCVITPTDSSYGLGVAEAGIYSADQQTCYCLGGSACDLEGILQTGQIGVPVAVIGGTDFYTVQPGDTFTAIAGGQVYGISIGGYQQFTIVTTITV